MWRRWRRLFAVTLPVSLALGLTVAFLLPPRYRATAILLPPDERGLPPLASAERDELGGRSLAPGPLEVLETPAGLAARLLSTGPIVDGAVRRLAPAGGWGAGEECRVRGRIAAGLRAWVTDEKIVLVQVEAEDPAAAAAAANALGEALDEWSRERRSRLARARRESLEREIADIGTRLAALGGTLGAEGSLRSPDMLVTLPGEPGKAAREVVALGGTLSALGQERGRARAEEIDPRPVIEFVERAVPPARPARPIRAAVTMLVLVAGFLGTAAVASVVEAAGRSRHG